MLENSNEENYRQAVDDNETNIIIIWKLGTSLLVNIVNDGLIFPFNNLYYLSGKFEFQSIVYPFAGHYFKIDIYIEVQKRVFKKTEQLTHGIRLYNSLSVLLYEHLKVLERC
jgi:hypothetical protein